MAKKNKYKCIYCNKIVKRQSKKRWIKSYCDEVNKMVHLQLVVNKYYL